MFTTLEFWVWVATAVLVVMYGLPGFMKTFRPIPNLAKMLPWTVDVPPALVRFIGVAEILGPIGLVLPVLTRLLPWLTPLAALGLIVIQLLAIPFHARRGETAKTLPFNLVLLALGAFVFRGRMNFLGL